MSVKSYLLNVELDKKSLKENEDGSFYISGIANNKGKQDDYGDIPTNFNGQPVYDLTRYLKNPIALIDHNYGTESIIGTFTKLIETKRGLEFEFKAMANPVTERARHAKQAIKEGILRTLSIGGRWFFEDPENPNNLTKAFIYEISFVTIPADSDALTDMPIRKSVQGEQPENVDSLIKQFEETEMDDMKLLHKICELLKQEKKGKQ